ncbi:MAG: hypothetical protein SF187_02415 [Deltaproteobacteria bacterium]|nr:hypothetical protein [Deltaproteobacteria bacterium]
MPIDAVSGPTSYDAEVLVKAKQQQKVEGEAAVKLIEESGAAQQEQRRIKHPDSTISIVA